MQYARAMRDGATSTTAGKEKKKMISSTAEEDVQFSSGGWNGSAFAWKELFINERGKKVCACFVILVYYYSMNEELL